MSSRQRSAAVARGVSATDNGLAYQRTVHMAPVSAARASHGRTAERIFRVIHIGPPVHNSRFHNNNLMG